MQPEATATWPDDAVEVGLVIGAWGVRGAVKVSAESADAAALRSASRWWLRLPSRPDNPGAATSYACESVRRQGDAVVATLAGIGDRDAAQALAGARVHVPRSAFPKAGPDEFYWVDLIGCEVVNREGQGLGRVAGLIDTGAHSVLRVVGDGDASERLIPFVDAYVGQVDTDARRIEVDWGLDY